MANLDRFPGAGRPYRSKEVDHTGTGLAMLLAASRNEEVPHTHCLTCRPILLRLLPHAPREWLTPVVSASDGVSRALRLCKIPSRSWVLSGSTEQRRAQLLDAWQESGGRPLLCGPLDQAKLWNRYENRYSSLAAHFVLILAMDRSDRAILHDPEGVAFAARPAIQLLNALQDPQQASLFAIESNTPIQAAAISQRAFREAIRLRLGVAAGPLRTARGLRDLAGSLGGPLLGSDLEGLRIGLSFAGRCAASFGALARDNDVPSVQAVLANHSRATALADRALIRTDASAVKSALEYVADLEDALDRELAKVAPRFWAESGDQGPRPALSKRHEQP